MLKVLLVMGCVLLLNKPITLAVEEEKPFVEPSGKLEFVEDRIEAKEKKENKKKKEETAAGYVSIDLGARDSLLLQKIAVAEAGCDGEIGMAFVIRVILNRVHSPKFPNTIEEVITQPDQFTAYSNGSFDKAEITDLSAKALFMVENGWDSTLGATYFESSRNCSGWHYENLTKVAEYGGHWFYVE